jgi:RNA polymerase sigma-70 factor (ECF subfamily)
MSHSEQYNEFVRLIRLNTGQVLAYINALLLNWNDAEDLFQETCLVLWQKFDDFKPGTNFLAWALRIAEHKVMDFQKMRSRRIAFTARLREELKSDFMVPEERSAASLAALSRCMDVLSDGDRSMVTLCYGEGLPVARVAETMDCSKRTVYRSLLRIRCSLLTCIHRELERQDPFIPASPSDIPGEARP